MHRAGGGVRLVRRPQGCGPREWILLKMGVGRLGLRRERRWQDGVTVKPKARMSDGTQTQAIRRENQLFQRRLVERQGKGVAAQRPCSSFSASCAPQGGFLCLESPYSPRK